MESGEWNKVRVCLASISDPFHCGGEAKTQRVVTSTARPLTSHHAYLFSFNSDFIICHFISCAFLVWLSSWKTRSFKTLPEFNRLINVLSHTFLSSFVLFAKWEWKSEEITQKRVNWKEVSEKHFALLCYQRLMGLEDGKFMEILKLFSRHLQRVLSLILCHRNDIRAVSDIRICSTVCLPTMNWLKESRDHHRDRVLSLSPVADT